MNQITTPTCGVLAGETEVIGERCADGGKCHHECAVSCFRRIACVPLTSSGLNDDWQTPAQEVLAAADRLTQRATELGLIVTIEHRRTPDAKPSTYLVEARAARSVYEQQLRKAASEKAQVTE